MYKFRYILNALVAAGRPNIWIAAFPEKSTSTPTESLEEIPTKPNGEEQPFWVGLY